MVGAISRVEKPELGGGRAAQRGLPCREMSELFQVQSDFNRIARLLASRPEHVEPYDNFLLREIPAPCDSLLEVGSGSGRMARLLASRARNVVGIDASSEMTSLARTRSAGVRGVQFICDDFMSHPFGDERFDCVLTVTTLHHLEVEDAIVRMASLVKPGGVLIVHDIREPSGSRDLAWSVVRATADGSILHWLRRRLTERGELSQAWRDHGATDVYPSLAAVRTLASTRLPGARIHDHALWRYTMVWKKPMS
jgi:ubiquinone/menaquinone biosynthesis C-methylase UbiE